MSKRLRRLARKAKLRQVLAGAAAHGCAACRSQEHREQLMKWILERGAIISHAVACAACGAEWLVEFFADEKGEAHMRISPVPSSPAKPN